jgi:hypothetical protein
VQKLWNIPDGGILCEFHHLQCIVEAARRKVPETARKPGIEEISQTVV